MSSIFSYRADIDGLRALALSLVILFHANIPLLTGGYIGVDVFFVISGFLITIIIAKEVNTGTFSYRNFYVRRIKRLLPALVFMLMGVTIPAYLMMFPDDFETYAKSMAHTFFGLNNFFLWNQTTGYFAENTELFPLLHTWSLAVEEQFYLIWSALFVLMHRFLRQNAIMLANIALLVIFLALSIYLTKHYSHSAYYLLPARTFEFLLGAFLAVQYDKIPKLSVRVNHVLSILGLGLILVPSFLLTSNSNFPGLNALWPCVGAVLLIISGKHATDIGIVNRLLTIKSIVFIGLMSYSLYLWHWPIMVFFKYAGHDISGIVRIAALILTLVLGYLSWKYVERPIRYAHLPNLRLTMLKLVLPSFLVVASLVWVIDGSDGIPSRFVAIPEFNKHINHPSRVRKACYGTFKIGNVDDCVLGLPNKEATGILIGDSYANHAAPFIDILAQDAGLRFYDTAASGYPVMTHLNQDRSFSKNTEYAEHRFEYAAQFEHIVISAFWQKYSSSSNVNYQQILDDIERYVSTGKLITIIISPPEVDARILHEARLAKASGLINDGGNVLVQRSNETKYRLVQQIKQTFPSIQIVDMSKVTCQKNECKLIVNDIVIYRNIDHLNVYGAQEIAKNYIEKFGNPLQISRR